MTPRIRIGNQTAWACSSPMEPFDFALRHGFDAFEWFADKKYHEGGSSGWEESDFDAGRRQEIRKIGETRDILFTVHAPWQANPLHENGAPLLRRSIDYARDIGADLMNLHLYMDAGPQGYVDSMLPILDYAAAAGVRVSIENTPHTTPDDFNRVFELFQKQTEIARVGMCLDIGHANLCECTRHDFLRYYSDLSDAVPLIHLHVHENYGDADTHLTLFTGPSAHDDHGIKTFLYRLQERGYRGAMILEQWPNPPGLLVDAERRLREILKSQRPVKIMAAMTAEESIRFPHRPTDEFVKEIADANSARKSWRERLQWVRELFVRPEFDPTLDQLAALSVYLRFMATGELACEEDGRHFRPNHHASAALEIETALERLAKPERQWILRRIYPWLPSGKSEFRRSEPLTRIRDIAHRNDIPRELKSEIKHRLQNKLHRCAGPEDLKTSQEILTRITAPDSAYSAAFVSEFKIFHDELSEFFNATQLEQRLQDLLQGLRPDSADAIRQFLDCKRGAAPIVLLEALTDLRRALALETTLSNPEMRAEIRMADIGLEDFAFPLLGECVSADAFKNGNPNDFFRAVLAALENLRLSGIDPDECAATHAELTAWSREFSINDRFHTLRLAASLGRVQRLCQAYSEVIARVFTRTVERLGSALGITEPAIRFFVEGDIRGNIVFQLSRLSETSLKHINNVLKLSPWETIVPGHAEGPLLRISNLRDAEGLHGPVLVLLEKSDSEEEVPAGVRGIFLGHDIPHLSHLAVRARQAGVLLVAARDSADFNELAAHVGKRISADLGVDELRITELTRNAGGQPELNVAATPVKTIKVPVAELSDDRPIIPIDSAQSDTCGAKASGTRKLIELSAQSHGDSRFHCPRAMAISFRAFDLGLRASQVIEREYHSLLERANSASTKELDTICGQLRSLIFEFPLQAQIVQKLTGYFGEQTLLAVRSSANGEDLEALAGAGLYDSFVNVAPAGASVAIKKVWASLWTRRAALARIQAGIPHVQVMMAVLIQEMAEPEYSFIMHTANPTTGNRDESSVELAAGLGEVLASASEPGSPYRIICDWKNNVFQINSCANYSMAVWPSSSPGTIRSRLDYSKLALSSDVNRWSSLARRLSHVAGFVQDALGRPQDIEGVIREDKIHLVQSRAQQGLQ